MYVNWFKQEGNGLTHLTRHLLGQVSESVFFFFFTLCKVYCLMEITLLKVKMYQIINGSQIKISLYIKKQERINRKWDDINVSLSKALPYICLNGNSQRWLYYKMKGIWVPDLPSEEICQGELVVQLTLGCEITEKEIIL